MYFLTTYTVLASLFSVFYLQFNPFPPSSSVKHEKQENISIIREYMIGLIGVMSA